MEREGFKPGLLLIILGLLILPTAMSVDTATAKTRVELNIFYPGANSNISALGNFESKLGVTFNSVKWYQDWPEKFDGSVANRLHNNGRLPEWTWQPQNVSYSDVVAGKYDAYLDQTANSVKSLGYKVRISLAPEMNSDWVSWGIGHQGNNNDNHKAFWRYVVNRFRTDGANNVDWVWAANIRYGGDFYSFAQIYPGDDYVNYTGLDGYNWGTSQSWSEWQSFAQVFQPSYNEITSVSSRPVLIMETASTEVGGNKADWILDMFKQLNSGFGRIQGITWFNINKETDWRIDSSPESQEAFKNGANGIISSNNNGSNSGGNSSSSQRSDKTGGGKIVATGKTTPTSEPTITATPSVTDEPIEEASNIEPLKATDDLVAGEYRQTSQIGMFVLFCLIVLAVGATFLNLNHNLRYLEPGHKKHSSSHIDSIRREKS